MKLAILLVSLFVLAIAITPTVDAAKIGIIGDVDNNSGLTTQINLMKSQGVKYFILPGDYAYSSASGVKSKLAAAGFNSSNSVVAVGNHDSCSDVKSWMKTSSCYYERVRVNGKIQFLTIDANSGFDCTGTQFNFIKSKLQSSTAWYKIVIIHQPFATVKSTHGANGKYSCYEPIFKANNVSIIAQAHNHNYQYGLIDSETYLVAGGGTHDTGSGMYPCSSSSFNGVSMKCITGTNGAVILDVNTTNSGFKHIDGSFVSNSGTVKHTFTVNK